MEITPIKTQRDYRRVLKEIEGLMQVKRNTPDGDRLDVLVTLVEAWERKRCPLDLPDAIEAIKYIASAVNCGGVSAITAGVGSTEVL
jgi:HTH-type transcriptional regulator / antitoxin HigA